MIGKGIGDSLTMMVWVLCFLIAVVCFGIGYGVAQLVSYLV